MNKYIEVVKRWKAGEVFSGEQLTANSDAAWVAARAANVAYVAAARAARASDADNADYWVKRYEELTNDK